MMKKHIIWLFVFSVCLMSLSGVALADGDAVVTTVKPLTPEEQEATAEIQGAEEPLLYDESLEYPADQPLALEEQQATANIEYAEEPLPYDELIEFPADHSFWLRGFVRDEDNAIISLTLVKKADSLPYLKYDSDYKEVRCEADGFELLSQESVTTGEEFLLAISPELPENRAAVLTLRVMDGDVVKATFYFYGVKTHRGIFVESNSHSMWYHYYSACRYAGEYTDEQYAEIAEIIRLTEGPILKDPIHPTSAPNLTLAANGRTAQIEGDFTGLYARVALELNNNGRSGLYVTQATVNLNGSIVIPSFQVPGLTVTGVNVSLVETLDDISSPTPNTVAMDFMRL